MTARKETRPGRLRVLDHPMVRIGMTTLRNKRTGVPQFRDTLRQMARIIAAESLDGVRTKRMRVETPLAKTAGWESAQKVVLVPVLRAGLGLVDGFLDIWPGASIGHIGLYRDEETLEPVEYYANLPASLDKAYVVVLDPMLATGGSAAETLSLLRRQGVRGAVLATLIAAPEGVRFVRKRFPDVRIITCALDERLNEVGFIVPGLGDAGDRLFGT